MVMRSDKEWCSLYSLLLLTMLLNSLTLFMMTPWTSRSANAP